jgi:hypothetical protein
MTDKNCQESLSACYQNTLLAINELANYSFCLTNSKNVPLSLYKKCVFDFTKCKDNIKNPKIVNVRIVNDIKTFR